MSDDKPLAPIWAFGMPGFGLLECPDLGFWFHTHALGTVLHACCKVTAKTCKHQACQLLCLNKRAEPMTATHHTVRTAVLDPVLGTHASRVLSTDSKPVQRVSTSSVCSLRPPYPRACMCARAHVHVCACVLPPVCLCAYVPMRLCAFRVIPIPSLTVAHPYSVVSCSC